MFRTSKRGLSRFFGSTMLYLATSPILGAAVCITAALDLADQGIRVYLVEKNATIGGKMAQLDRIYPTDDCAI